MLSLKIANHSGQGTSRTLVFRFFLLQFQKTIISLGGSPNCGMALGVTPERPALTILHGQFPFVVLFP
ncbi:MAG: hypothetical protein CMJ47_03430 [Planctomyces sp.]|nr:hypothetical protein [Planctomyces sp.]